MKKVTVYDVAAAAGVSVATVSRVLNNPESVKEQTRQKILFTMDEMGYVGKKTKAAENAEADTEKDRENLIMVIIPSYTNPFHSTALEGVKNVAKRRGFDVLMYNYDHNDFTTSFENLCVLIDKLHVCGIVLLSAGIGADRIRLLEEKVPVVQCAEIIDEPDVTFVAIDDYAAARNATNYLLRHGRTKVMYMQLHDIYPFTTRRENGYRDALLEEGIPYEKQMVVNLPDDYDSSGAIISAYLNQKDRPDAIFASSDVLAMSAISAIAKKGLRIPEDVSVIGYDDTYLAAMTNPPLTTVHQPIRKMGEIACKMIIDRFFDPSVTTHEHILLNTDLVIRSTTQN